MPQINCTLNIYIQITLTSFECLLAGVHSRVAFLKETQCLLKNR